MGTEPLPIPLNYETPSEFNNAVLAIAGKSGRGPRWTRAAINFFATAVVSATGGMSSFLMGTAGAGIAAATGLWSEASQDKTNDLHAACIQEMRGTLEDLKTTIGSVLISIRASDEQFEARMGDPNYLALVRRAFNNWSRDKSEDKREMIRRLLSHAADMQDPDFSLFNLFFDWVGRYNELHFRLIRSLKEQGRATKFQIWEGMGGTRVRDDSAEADVFACLFMDLNFGHIVRKSGGRDSTGRKVRATPAKRGSSPYLKSVLDNSDLQELTAVGELFIHYAMEELVVKLPGVQPPPA